MREQIFSGDRHGREAIQRAITSWEEMVDYSFSSYAEHIVLECCWLKDTILTSCGALIPQERGAGGNVSSMNILNLGVYGMQFCQIMREPSLYCLPKYALVTRLIVASYAEQNNLEVQLDDKGWVHLYCDIISGRTKCPGNELKAFKERIEEFMQRSDVLTEVHKENIRRITPSYAGAMTQVKHLRDFAKTFRREEDLRKRFRESISQFISESMTMQVFLRRTMRRVETGPFSWVIFGPLIFYLHGGKMSLVQINVIEDISIISEEIVLSQTNYRLGRLIRRFLSAYDTSKSGIFLKKDPTKNDLHQKWPSNKQIPGICSFIGKSGGIVNLLLTGQSQKVDCSFLLNIYIYIYIW